MLRKPIFKFSINDITIRTAFRHNVSYNAMSAGIYKHTILFLFFNEWTRNKQQEMYIG